jgi:hypothetical protein
MEGCVMRLGSKARTRAKAIRSHRLDEILIQAERRQQRKIVFDDGGVRWSDDTVAFQKALHSTLASRALAMYSVVNIGFVAAEQLNRGVSIHLRPAAASGAALAGLFYWLCSQQLSRVIICSYQDMHWRYALVSSRDEAMALLCRLR